MTTPLTCAVTTTVAEPLMLLAVSVAMTVPLPAPTAVIVAVPEPASALSPTVFTVRTEAGTVAHEKVRPGMAEPYWS